MNWELGYECAPVRMMDYYNDNDPKVCAWLEELIRQGELPAGDVDSRSITEIEPHELEGYRRCHFFAGIGGWALALELAGWGDEPVWTGSCPCQPLSSAGQRKGHADERHLWPAFFRLIAERQPATVFGEQVASALGREWFAGVRADLEALGYACGAADLCAAGIGAPHIRQRLFWVADATDERAGRTSEAEPRCDRTQNGISRPHSGTGTERLDDASSARHFSPRERAENETRNEARLCRPESGCADGWLADAEGERFDGQQDSAGPRGRRGAQDDGRLGDTDEQVSQGRGIDAGEYADQLAPWAASVAIPCADGKLRRVPANEKGEPEPGLFPLAHGLPARLVSLRGSGNAIVPQVAAQFVMAAREASHIAKAVGEGHRIRELGAGI